LRNAKHICHGACNGQEAIDVFNSNVDKKEARFDCILMDSEMPIMNGPMAVKHLRAQLPPYDCDIPIFGTTGNALPEDVASFMSMGLDDVIEKPLKLSALDDA